MVGTRHDFPALFRGVREFSLLSEYDIFLFKQGRHFRLYEKLGSHHLTADGVEGVYFAVWAPNALSVSVIGDFNAWRRSEHLLLPRPDESGIWEGFIAGVTLGAIYKYHIKSRYNGYAVDKADPFAFRFEVPPRTASIVWDLDYGWGDSKWLAARRGANSLDAAMAIYEVHLGSWRRVPEEGNRSLSFRELSGDFVEYVRTMGFTHVELLPVCEHPYYGSWGYQTTGYFSPTARYGLPQDFMYLVDALHGAGIGVLLDWVPSHFPGDEFALSYFDGTNLFEHADPRQGFHPEWKSYIFNYGRNEVSSFLGSSALFWLDRYHIDGLRVDAVASMLYLDYARQPGEWVPNYFGGNENFDAMHFLRALNQESYREHPDVQMIAEESTAWPMVTRPADLGGLGFGLKWNMGWMHDTLEYFSRETIHRKYHHNQLTFSLWYAFFENFVLPLSHDEVVHGKGSLLGKMPGDDWQKFANLRLLFGYLYAHPGKKLIFMGGEFGQWKEWNHEHSLDWHLLGEPAHRGLQLWVQDLNRVYRSEPALYQQDFQSEGFEWIDFHDWEKSIVSFIRKGLNPSDTILVACNFTPVVRTNYRIGVPVSGFWREVLNSDGECYGGSGTGNCGGAESVAVEAHGRPHSISLTLPPLAVLFFRSPGA
ncbi:MAG: 1,4-alpha-glucan branching protein GlgB [Acidiferrobacterales bacterium]